MGRAGTRPVQCLHSPVRVRVRANQFARAIDDRVHCADTTRLGRDGIQEIHHRVKNNLMRMVEIVRLERMHVPAVHGGLNMVLGDLENRVQGMALVHTMLSSTQWRPLPLNDLVTQIITAALSASGIWGLTRHASATTVLTVSSSKRTGEDGGAGHGVGGLRVGEEGGVTQDGQKGIGAEIYALPVGNGVTEIGAGIIPNDH